jgi:hypothetical protein
MPIGTSDGEYFDNALDHSIAKVEGMPSPQPIDPSRPKVYITPYEEHTQIPIENRGSNIGEDENYINPEEKGFDTITRDRNEAINTDNRIPEDYIRKISGTTSSTMPEGSTEKAAGEFKSESGIQVPEKPSLSESIKSMLPWTPVGPEEAKRMTKITQEDIDKGINVALSVGAGTIAGVKSQTFNHAALDEAIKMGKSGVDAQTIWEKTGTFLGADAQPRQEISNIDNRMKPEALKMAERDQMKGTELDKAKFKLPPTKIIPYEYSKPGSTAEEMDLNIAAHHKAQEAATLKVKDIFHLGELGEAYPHLKDIKVVPLSLGDVLSGTKGWHNVYHNTIALGQDTLEGMRSTLLHELQHAIQAHEGFSSGASPEMFHSPRWKDLSKEFQEFKTQTEKDIKQFYGGDKTKVFDLKRAVASEDAVREFFQRVQAGEKPGWISTWTKKEMMDAAQNIIEAKESGFYDDIKKIVKGEGISGEYGSLSFDRYKRVMGEVESRNVQKRLDPSEAAKSPRETEDISRAEQIPSPLDIAEIPHAPPIKP